MSYGSSYKCKMILNRHDFIRNIIPTPTGASAPGGRRRASRSPCTSISGPSPFVWWASGHPGPACARGGRDTAPPACGCPHAPTRAGRPTPLRATCLSRRCACRGHGPACLGRRRDRPGPGPDAADAPEQVARPLANLRDPG